MTASTKVSPAGAAPQREAWGSKMEFLLTCMGYAVGLGNVWRFPYLCGRNGGAAFLIPYFLMMVFAGLPLFYIEMAMGQYGAMTPAILYSVMCPIFSGIGTATIIISAYTGLYYNMIIAWSIHFFVNSFSSTLPWDGCNHDWNTEHCFDDRLVDGCAELGQQYFSGDCWNVSMAANLSFYRKINDTYALSKVTPANEYLNRKVLTISKGIHDMGYPKLDLLACLAAAWLIIFLILAKGVKSVGKVVYFTSTFPYVILCILLIRGATLKGAEKGIRFYMIPEMGRLRDGKVWGDAAVQIAFSLGLGGGGLTTLASFNSFHNNVFQDTLIVVLGNCFTSIFAGFVIFSILGFIATVLHKDMAEVAAEGVGLAFIAYPDAISRIQLPRLWAVLFFFMLLLLGIGSQIVFVDVVVTAIIDRWPRFRHPHSHPILVALVCTTGFILGISLTCPGSPYLITLLDNFGAGYPLLVVCLAEVVMVGWVYGLNRFVADVCLILGINYRKDDYREMRLKEMNPFWWINWKFITPSLLLFIIIFTLATFERTKYGKLYVFPEWAVLIGWCMTLSSIIWILIQAVICYLKGSRDSAGSADLLKKLTNPKPHWGAVNIGKSISNSSVLLEPPHKGYYSQSQSNLSLSSIEKLGAEKLAYNSFPQGMNLYDSGFNSLHPAIPNSGGKLPPGGNYVGSMGSGGRTRSSSTTTTTGGSGSSIRSMVINPNTTITTFEPSTVSDGLLLPHHSARGPHTFSPFGNIMAVAPNNAQPRTPQTAASRRLRRSVSNSTISTEFPVVSQYPREPTPEVLVDPIWTSRSGSSISSYNTNGTGINLIRGSHVELADGGRIVPRTQPALVDVGRTGPRARIPPDMAGLSVDSFLPGGSSPLGENQYVVNQTFINDSVQSEIW